VKASVLIFTFAFGVCLKLEAFKIKTLLSVMAISMGLGIAVLSAKHISAFGVSLCLGASASGGLRWVLVQGLVETDKKANHILAVLYKFSPIAAFALLPAVLVFEVPHLIGSPFMPPEASALKEFQLLLYCAIGGALSSTLIVVEILLLNVTSSLTMAVLGQVKEILQIALSMIIFKDNLSLRSIFGIGCSILAATYYRQIKVAELEGQEEAVSGSGDADEVIELLPVRRMMMKLSSEKVSECCGKRDERPE
jgi:drug/metabolite transporter (DMT)-like permease